MRYPFIGTTRNQSGAVVFGATISVYLAGTTTPADIYTAATGGSAVHSVVSSLTDGTFAFYVELTNTPFDIVVTKSLSANSSYAPVTLYGLIPMSAVSTTESVLDYTDTVMTGDLTVAYTANIIRTTCILDGGVAPRTVYVSGTFVDGNEIKIINFGSVAITFDETGDTVAAGDKQSFYYSLGGWV